MEEQIKTILPELAGVKKEEDKDLSKFLLIIFIPIITIIILCFRYHTLRIFSLCLSGLGMSYILYKSFNERKRKFDKERVAQLILVILTAIGIFNHFIGDLVLSCWAILLSSLLLMTVLKIENEKQKVYIAYYVFFGAIITAIVLNYGDILIFVKNIINYF